VSEEQGTPAKAKSINEQIKVRACSIICKTNPEWGTFGVMEDRGFYWEIYGDGGGRVLHKSEAEQFWEMAPKIELASDLRTFPVEESEGESEGLSV